MGDDDDDRNYSDDGDGDDKDDYCDIGGDDETNADGVGDV